MADVITEGLQMVVRERTKQLSEMLEEKPSIKGFDREGVDYHRSEKMPAIARAYIERLTKALDDIELANAALQERAALTTPAPGGEG